MTLNLKSRWKQLSKLDKFFAIVVALYLLLLLVIPGSGFTTFAQLAVIVIGCWLLVRLVRIGLRKAIWRLRNRLIVAYVLIAVVPILLILTLVGLVGYMLASQVAVYLVRSELDRRAAAMRAVTEIMLRAEPKLRAETLRRTGEVYRERYPEVVLLIADHGTLQRWPEDAAISPPAGKSPDMTGIVWREGRYYALSRATRDDVQFLAMTPLTRRYLSTMIPELGDVYFLQVSETQASEVSDSKGAKGDRRSIQIGTTRRPNAISVGDQRFNVQPTGHDAPGAVLPPAANRFDFEVRGFSLVRTSDWSSPEKSQSAILMVHTRLSAILQIILSQNLGELQPILSILLIIISIAFLIVEIVSLIIGVVLTRTITGAVHSLYEGTQRVMKSDFTHRISVSGGDQLAELSKSFNTMTENLERLLVVAKEKERMQAELEIAREVQEQLYPKAPPVLKTLRLTGLCQPARMVSGDYYDYQAIAGNKAAIAIGDVAGKGISAALLMATIQSAMRMELRASIEHGAPPHVALNGFRLSTARMVSELNQQLHATTAPEKFATFWFAVYDEDSGVMTYTNAGHLPPILIRDGDATRLDVNGMVVGAFPMSLYDESKVQLRAGDLLVCYTDGITEPENEYGEMFGEERLIELVSKNTDRDESDIIERVMEAVRQWTGVPELSDDMTVVLARKQ